MTSNLPVPEWFSAPAIFAKFEQGKTSDAIAKELGVRRVDLVRQIKAHPEDFREMRIALQYIRMEDAHEEMDAAAEAGEYQKVKAYESVIRSCQWELERVYRDVYGEPKERAIVNPVQININLRRQDGTEQTAAYKGTWPQPMTEVNELERTRAALPEQAGSPTEDAEIVEQKLKPEPKAEPKPEPKKQQRMVYVPPSPKPGNEIDYGEWPSFT